MEQKKTTMMLEEGLYQQVRIRAAERGVSASLIVSEALAVYLGQGRPTKPFELIKGTPGTWIADVDTSSNRAMLDFLDEDVPFEKLR